MSQALSNQNPLLHVDDSYRRSSAMDASRPSEWVRRKVVAHASQAGAARAVRDSTKACASRGASAQSESTSTSESPARFAVFGAVAAGAVVVAFAGWYFLSGRP